MSLEKLHLELATDARTRHILTTQMLLVSALRRTLSISGNPVSEQLYQSLVHQISDSIADTHGEYILGRGPVAQNLFQILRITKPELTNQQILNDHIQPRLPKIRDLGNDEKADRSANRHWATMVRVAMGANDQGHWNREGLDQLYVDGKILDLSELIKNRELMSEPGAKLLRIQHEDHVSYLVRVVTREFNQNTMTAVDGVPGIEASIYVSLEGTWCHHNDGSLFDDAEVEGYVTAMLKELGLDETPLPVQPTEAPAMEEISEAEANELIADAPNRRGDMESQSTDVSDWREMAAEAGVDTNPADPDAEAERQAVAENNKPDIE